MTTAVADLVYQRGLSTRFATCPPRFALLLDLRKTRWQPTLQLVTLVLKNLHANLWAATGMVCLPQRSQGGGRSLVMLRDKKLENPWRKHGNIPL